jgi:hypothetical protein
VGGGLPGKAPLSEAAGTDPMEVSQDQVGVARAHEFERGRTQAGDGCAEPILGLRAGSRPSCNEPQNLAFRWAPAVESQQILEGLGTAHGFIHEPILGSREIRPGRTPLDGGPNPSRPWPAGQGGYPLASAFWVWGLEGEEPAWPQGQDGSPAPVKRARTPDHAMQATTPFIGLGCQSQPERSPSASDSVFVASVLLRTTMEMEGEDHA